MKIKTKNKQTAEEAFASMGSLSDIASTVIILSEPDEYTSEQDFSVFRYGEKVESRKLKLQDNKWIEIA